MTLQCPSMTIQWPFNDQSMTMRWPSRVIPRPFMNHSMAIQWPCNDRPTTVRWSFVDRSMTVQ
eukprot:9592533-Lingulodinium_polyedra.AAC.1